MEASHQLRIFDSSYSSLVDPSNPSRQPSPAKTCRPRCGRTTMALAFKVRPPNPTLQKLFQIPLCLERTILGPPLYPAFSTHQKNIKLIGKSRLEEFLINTLYPLHPENWAEFQQIPASAPNQKVKRSCERLFGSLVNAEPHLKFAWQQQALLQVYQDFCLEDLSNCNDCSFSEQLAQWKSNDD